MDLSLMELAVQSLRAGLPAFLLHFAVTLGILAAGIVVYAALTPHHELRLIREGNSAAALSFGAAILGLALPLCLCMATSLNWMDLLIWGIVTVVFQLFVFRIVDLLLRGLPQRIRSGDMAAAVFLATVKLATSLLLAAAVTGAPLARL